MLGTSVWTNVVRSSCHSCYRSIASACGPCDPVCLSRRSTDRGGSRCSVVLENDRPTAIEVDGRTHVGRILADEASVSQPPAGCPTTTTWPWPGCWGAATTNPWRTNNSAAASNSSKGKYCRWTGFCVVPWFITTSGKGPLPEGRNTVANISTSGSVDGTRQLAVGRRSLLVHRGPKSRRRAPPTQSTTATGWRRGYHSCGRVDRYRVPHSRATRTPNGYVRL
jgi:hypothetical protein